LDKTFFLSEEVVDFLGGFRILANKN
jgi:hypothetical protein